MKHRWGVIGFVAVISFASGGFLLQRSVQADAASEESLFDDVMSHVNNYYVDSLGNADLYRRATEGMLDQLQDPYSVLLTGDDYRALTEQTTGNYGGLGIQIDVRDGWITVVAPLPAWQPTKSKVRDPDSPRAASSAGATANASRRGIASPRNCRSPCITTADRSP